MAVAEPVGIYKTARVSTDSYYAESLRSSGMWHLRKVSAVVAVVRQRAKITGEAGALACPAHACRIAAACLARLLPVPDRQRLDWRAVWLGEAAALVPGTYLSTHCVHVCPIHRLPLTWHGSGRRAASEMGAIVSWGWTQGLHCAWLLAGARRRYATAACGTCTACSMTAR